MKTEGTLGGMVYHLRISELARACPGVRCDGMHFGSDFPEFKCSSSEALWDGFLANFLTETFPSPPLARQAEHCRHGGVHASVSPEEVAECGSQRKKVAVLLVGTSSITEPVLELHMRSEETAFFLSSCFLYFFLKLILFVCVRMFRYFRAMMESVLKPHRADVFAVTDDVGGMALVEALPAQLGNHLKGRGLVSSAFFPVVVADTFLTREPPIVHFSIPLPEVERAHLQWHKLHSAWELMKQHELKGGFSYDLVVKLRFDATPLGTLNICGSSSALTATPKSPFKALHACTDMMFWGTRDVMEVAASGTWTAISSYFEGEGRRDSMSRSFYVTPLVESLQAVPSEFWRQPMLLNPWKMVSYRFIIAYF